MRYTTDSLSIARDAIYSVILEQYRPSVQCVQFKCAAVILFHPLFVVINDFVARLSGFAELYNRLCESVDADLVVSMILFPLALPFTFTSLE